MTTLYKHIFLYKLKYDLKGHMRLYKTFFMLKVTFLQHKNTIVEGHEKD